MWFFSPKDPKHNRTRVGLINYDDDDDNDDDDNDDADVDDNNDVDDDDVFSRIGFLKDFNSVRSTRVIRGAL